MDDHFKELKLFTLSEAAKVLSVGRDTLKKLIAVGDIGFIQVGKNKKIPYLELSRFLNENVSRNKSGNEGSLSDNEIKKFFGLSRKSDSLSGGDILENILRNKQHGISNKKRENPARSMV